MSEPPPPGPPDPQRTTWVGRAKAPPPPPPPTDPYWSPVVEPQVVYLQYPRRNRSGLTILLVVVGVLVAACASGITLALLSSFGDENSGIIGKAPPGLDTPVKDGRFEFVVTATTCGHETLGSLIKLTAKGQYCIVDVSVTNTGTEAQSFADALQKALGADGSVYDADSGAGLVVNLGATALWNTVGPGKTVTAKIVYDIPDDARLAKLELHDSLFSAGVTVTLPAP